MSDTSKINPHDVLSRLDRKLSQQTSPRKTLKIVLCSLVLVWGFVIPLSLFIARYFDHALLNTQPGAFTGSKIDNWNYLNSLRRSEIGSLPTPRNAAQLLRNSATDKVHLIAEIIRPFNFSDFERLKLAHDIVSLSNKSEVDPLLVASVVAAESSFRHQLTSYQGAIGLMQVMPQTALMMARQAEKENYPTQRKATEEQKNLDLGIRYLKQLLSQYNNDIRLALAAYNWGPGNVEQVRRDFSLFPTSVQNYVNKVHGQYQKWKKADKKENRVG